MARGPIKGSKINVICDGCGKEFIVNRSKFKRAEKSVNFKLYCSRECYKVNGHWVGRKKSKYLDCYYCRHCEKWIPHTAAIIYNSNGKMTYPICPHNGCYKVRLVTSPRNSKFKTKYIEQKHQMDLEQEQMQRKLQLDTLDQLEQQQQHQQQQHLISM